mmetsp:Transcript_17558/g.8276  ORF Transcript_17558/g.8276 Transcript_17558/m.8276 type:complete len:134 (-) Transcript_17558:287-688(-)
MLEVLVVELQQDAQHHDEVGGVRVRHVGQAGEPEALLLDEGGDLCVLVEVLDGFLGVQVDVVEEVDSLQLDLAEDGFESLLLDASPLEGALGLDQGIAVGLDSLDWLVQVVVLVQDPQDCVQSDQFLALGFVD